MDDKALSNVFITDVLARGHRALSVFRERAQTEDGLREVLGDMRMTLVRTVHRISVDVTYFESIHGEYQKTTALLASLAKKKAPSASEASSSSASTSTSV